MQLTGLHWNLLPVGTASTVKLSQRVALLLCSQVHCHGVTITWHELAVAVPLRDLVIMTLAACTCWVQLMCKKHTLSESTCS
jgi:hypothetical protein